MTLALAIPDIILQSPKFIVGDMPMTTPLAGVICHS